MHRPPTVRGQAFLGFTPRAYFEDERASAPTDVAREASGLAAWAAAMTGKPAPNASAIQVFLASDVADEPGDDDEDVFVEIKAGRLLDFLGIGRPAGLSGG